MRTHTNTTVVDDFFRRLTDTQRLNMLQHLPETTDDRNTQLQKMVIDMVEEKTMTTDLLNRLTKNGNNSVALAHVMCTHGDKPAVTEFLATLNDEQRKAYLQYIPPPSKQTCSNIPFRDITAR